jgi:rubrerythrin
MSPDALPHDAPGVLEASRVREKAQSLFYRALAAEAAGAGAEDATERLNELHADEQHHLSRLTARLLELGHRPRELSAVPTPAASLDGWEPVARAREEEEVRWYETVVELALDGGTRRVLEEILASEHNHLRELRGKWMSA